MDATWPERGRPRPQQHPTKFKLKIQRACRHNVAAAEDGRAPLATTPNAHSPTPQNQRIRIRIVRKIAPDPPPQKIADMKHLRLEPLPGKTFLDPSHA